MKLSMAIKQEIARKAAIATIAKRRDAAYKTLQKDLTKIAEWQYVDVPVTSMEKFSEYINFENHLYPGDNYPDGFIEAEKRNRSKYRSFGFVPSSDIPLLKYFPCKADKYYLAVIREYEGEYEKAVRKYIHLYFEVQTTYNLILESLNTITSDKQLEDEFPELLIFFTLPEENEKQPIPKERIAKCKSLLKENRKLFLDSLQEVV
jgi:hypothetical protein